MLKYFSVWPLVFHNFLTVTLIIIFNQEKEKRDLTHKSVNRIRCCPDREEAQKPGYRSKNTSRPSATQTITKTTRLFKAMMKRTCQISVRIPYFHISLPNHYMYRVDDDPTIACG
jgi:hypothetical protein